MAPLLVARVWTWSLDFIKRLFREHRFTVEILDSKYLLDKNEVFELSISSLSESKNCVEMFVSPKKPT